MQWPRFVLYSVVATLGIGAVAIAADALVENDTEQLDEIADVLTQDRADARIDGLLAWADPARETVIVRGDRGRERFSENDGLGDSLHGALAVLDERELDVVQRTVAIEGARGHVRLRVRGTGDEIVDVDVALRRDGQGWLLSEVRAFD